MTIDNINYFTNLIIAAQTLVNTFFNYSESIFLYEPNLEGKRNRGRHWKGAINSADKLTFLRSKAYEVQQLNCCSLRFSIFYFKLFWKHFFV